MTKIDHTEDYKREARIALSNLKFYIERTDCSNSGIKFALGLLTKWLKKEHQS